MQTNVIRYGSQALVMFIGSMGILFFGLMCPVFAFFNPLLAVGSFIFAGAISFATVEVVDRIEDWADDQLYITA